MPSEPSTIGHVVLTSWIERAQKAEHEVRALRETQAELVDATTALHAQVRRLEVERDALVERVAHLRGALGEIARGLPHSSVPFYSPPYSTHADYALRADDEAAER